MSDSNNWRIFGIEREDLLNGLVDMGWKLFLAIIILVLGFWLAKMMGKLVIRLLSLKETDKGLTSFLSSFVVLAIKVFSIFYALTQLGVQMASILTILASAGLAIGLAFSGTLSNFAGGIMILIVKPFKVGDTISALLSQGEVISINVFNTYIKTADNKIVIFPNGPLANGAMVNLSSLETRRIDVIIPIKYGERSKEICAKTQEFLEKHKVVLKDPSPQLFFSEFDATHGKLNIVCWVPNSMHTMVSRELSNELFAWMEAVDE